MVGEFVFGILAKGAVGALLGDQAKAWLKDKAKRKAFERVITRGHEAFSRTHPDLVASFFDRPFIEQSIAPELAKFFTRGEKPSAKGIADAYRAQFSASTRDVSTEARAFLSLVESELSTEPELQELVSHRQIEAIAREVGHLSEIRDLLLVPSTIASVEVSESADSPESLRLASSGLLSWPQTLGRNQWIARLEEGALLQRIAESEQSATLLLGVPGSGKSALLARVATICLAKGYAVLALKADQLPGSVSSLDSLRQASDLHHPILTSLRVLSRDKRVVLLVDQLDALGELVDLHTDRLNVLLRLVRAAKNMPNLHIVCSCRTFERRYDVHLSGLEAEEIELSLPTWASIQEVLDAYKLKGDSWPEAFREVLRTPQCLKLFLHHFAGSGERAVFESYHRMLEHLFTERLFRSAEHQSAGTLLLRLATAMADAETLFLPVARYDAGRTDLNYLVASDMLRYDDSGRSISFTHQTIFDFARARAFVAQEGSLSAFVLTRQSALYVRPKVWSALAYLRGSDAATYERELSALWSAPDLRAHLRILLIEFIGLQDEPSYVERQTLRPMFSDRTYRAKAFFAIVGRKVWFDLIQADELPRLMAEGPREAWPARAVLQAAWAFARDEVLTLVKEQWVNDSEKHGLAWYTLRELQDWKDDALAVALAIVKQGKVADFGICDLALVISSTAPEVAVKFFAAHFRERLRQARAEPNPPPDIPEGASDLERGFALASWHRHGAVRDLLELRSTDYYHLPALAQAAPESFLTELWNDIRAAFAEVAETENKIVFEYRDDSMLATTFEEKGGVDSPKGEYPLMEAVLDAVLELARRDPARFKQFVDENKTSELMVVHRLLALGLCEIAATESAFCLEYLLGDPRRLSLENFHEDERETKALIRRLVPHLSDSDTGRLEQVIRSTSQYRHDYKEPDAKTRFDQQKWDRQFRLRLLSQIPRERLTAETQALMRTELGSAFPAFKDDRREVHMIATSSPMSADQMEKASDKALNNLLLVYPDTRGERDFFSHRGGSREVAMAFAEFAKRNPKRAVPMLRTLDPATHSLPVAHAIDTLESSSFSSEELFALISDLDQKGFKSGEFRGNAASALRKRAEAPRGLPDTMIDLLERWLRDYLPAPNDKRSATRKDTDEEPRSVLWGHGGFRILPHGSYPFLDAILFGLVLRDPIPQGSLFALLRTHVARQDEEEEWAAFSYSLSRVIPWLDQAESQSFISELFRRFPGIAATVEGAHLVASAMRVCELSPLLGWMDVVRNAPWMEAQCVYGELLGLVLYWRPSEHVPLDRLHDVQAAMKSGDTAGHRSFQGLVYSAANLWDHAKTRDVFRSILCDGLRSSDKHVARAALDFFRIWKGVELSHDTRPIFEAVRNGNALHAARSHTFLLEALADVLDDEPQLVYEICEKVITSSRDDLGNLATSAALDSEALINIALSLQRLPDPHRTNGLTLFERLIEHDAYRAREVLTDIDRRPGQSQPVRAMRRRKRKGRQ